MSGSPQLAVSTRLFGSMVPKDAEIIVDRLHKLSKRTQDIAFYERAMTKAFTEGRRVLRSVAWGLSCSPARRLPRWEAILQAVD